MKNQYLILICFLFLSSTIYSQEIKNETNEIRKNAISFNILGTTPILGITYERILSDKISFEIGLGIPSIGVGMKIFPYGITEGELMCDTGITTTYFEPFFFARCSIPRFLIFSIASFSISEIDFSASFFAGSITFSYTENSGSK